MEHTKENKGKYGNTKNTKNKIDTIKQILPKKIIKRQPREMQYETKSNHQGNPVVQSRRLKFFESASSGQTRFPTFGKT